MATKVEFVLTLIVFLTFNTVFGVIVALIFANEYHINREARTQLEQQQLKDYNRRTVDNEIEHHQEIDALHDFYKQPDQ